ncbi:MAG: hypothetical protein LBI19_07875 [Oscillospiraceae bacterium]|jgi:HD-GYP domain-containing protein (c-di-GMP phosphodiesterase class II)|nr:hypothetical protein [Oscillospiraceae bacterium]
MNTLLGQFSLPFRSHIRRVAVCSSIMAEYAERTIRRCDIPDGTTLPLIAHLNGTCHDLGTPIESTLDCDDFARKVMKAAQEIPLIANIYAIADRLDYYLWDSKAPDHEAITDDIIAQAGKRFSESAVVCFELAWPRLTEEYAKWKHL